MKNFILALVFLGLILPLYGCSVNTNLTRECVADTIDIPEQPSMYIASDIPQGAALSISREDGRCAVFSHPDYEIIQEIFSAESWEDAFLHVSGRGSRQLKPLLAGNFPHEKYRCTWTAAGEKGTDLCQCVIIFDGSFYYAISVQCAADKAGSYADSFSDLLSGATLCGV